MMVEEDQTASACDIMDVVEGIITGLGGSGLPYVVR